MILAGTLPARPMGEGDIVVAPLASQRATPVPARRAAIVVTSRAPPQERPADPAGKRGRIVDVLA
jgi:hypothetical protein